MIKEYKCTICDDVVEVWDRFDEVPIICSECGGPIKKIMSKNTFHLKGSGWYSTDYKNKNQKSVGKKESSL